MTRRKKSESANSKPGPKPETIKVEGDVDWTDALKHALNKPKPKEGWPKSPGKGDKQADD